MEEIEFDAVVIGLGAHGSSSVSALSVAKHRVLGLEKQSSSPHIEGSSHGQSRIIRLAYFEDHRYVPLLQRSLQLWKELDKAAEVTGGLLHLCGGLMIGKPDSEVIRGTLESIRVHNLPHQLLTASQIRQRFNVFAPEDNEVGVFEDTAGFLVPELCIRAFLTVATHHGSILHFGETVLGWERMQKKTGYYLVHTDKPATYTTKKIVICAGAWMSQLLANNSKFSNITTTACNTHSNALDSSNTSSSISLPSPIIPLHIERRVQYWFQLSKPVHFPLFAKLPVYIWDLGPGESFYGFPLMSDEMGASKGVKVALHQTSNSSDDSVDRQHCNPETIDRLVGEEEKKSMKQLLQRQIPLLGDDDTAGLLETATCMYTMTPDTHFIIDFYPGQQKLDSVVSNSSTEIREGGTEYHDGDPNIIIVSACSGHGFKFAPVIGEIVEQLISQQTTSHDISLFSISRFRSDTPP